MRRLPIVTYFRIVYELDISLASFASSHAWLSDETNILRRTGPTGWRDAPKATCSSSADVSLWSSRRSSKSARKPQPTVRAEPRQH